VTDPQEPLWERLSHTDSPPIELIRPLAADATR
jgi:hypothetical protein